MCEVQPVEHLPQVRVIHPHALQGGVQLVVSPGLGDPPEGLLLGQVVSFAHVLFSFPPSPFHDTHRMYSGALLLPADRIGGVGFPSMR